MAGYRVLCPNCKKVYNLPDDSPCPSCGTQVVIPRGGMIQIYRMGNFVGGAVPAGIYLNGQPYGHVPNRGTVQIPLPFGKYVVHMTVGMTRRCNDPMITLSPEAPVACLKAHIKMGFATNTMIIEPADPSTMPPVE